MYQFGFGAVTLLSRTINNKVRAFDRLSATEHGGYSKSKYSALLLSALTNLPLTEICRRVWKRNVVIARWRLDEEFRERSLQESEAFAEAVTVHLKGLAVEMVARGFFKTLADWKEAQACEPHLFSGQSPVIMDAILDFRDATFYNDAVYNHIVKKGFLGGDRLQFRGQEIEALLCIVESLFYDRAALRRTVLKHLFDSEMGRILGLVPSGGAPTVHQWDLIKGRLQEQWGRVRSGL